MALGGGTFLVHNKVLPGAYINFVSRPRAMGTMGDRGILAAMLHLNWGKEDEVFTVEAGDFQKDCLSVFGYSYQDNEMLYIREMFCGAKELRLFRPKSGDKAKAVHEGLTVTALHGGTRGNDITVTVQPDLDDDALYIVTTYIGEDAVRADEQAVYNLDELHDNAFVSFSGTGVPTETAGVTLTGGTDKAVVGNDHSVLLDKIEAEDFTTLVYAGNDNITKALYAAFTKRLRDDEGVKITTVVHNYAAADFEGVISVMNTATDPWGGAEDAVTALTYWVGGMTAGAQVNQSLTNKVYNGELTVETRFKKSEFIKAIEAGQFAFYGEKDEVKALKDINTFTSFEPYKNMDFANNQIIRVLDQIANDVARIFDKYYLGKVQNNDTGRDLFKAELINYHETLQGIQAITNFTADDIQISKGAEKGDVVVDEAVEPVGAMDKLYMTVTVI